MAKATLNKKIEKLKSEILEDVALDFVSKKYFQTDFK